MSGTLAVVTSLGSEAVLYWVGQADDSCAVEGVVVGGVGGVVVGHGTEEKKKRRVVGGEQGSNGISVLVSKGNELAIQLHVEPTS